MNLGMWNLLLKLFFADHVGHSYGTNTLRIAPPNSSIRNLQFNSHLVIFLLSHFHVWCCFFFAIDLYLCIMVISHKYDNLSRNLFWLQTYFVILMYFVGHITYFDVVTYFVILTYLVALTYFVHVIYFCNCI